MLFFPPDENLLIHSWVQERAKGCQSMRALKGCLGAVTKLLSTREVHIQLEFF